MDSLLTTCGLLAAVFVVGLGLRALGSQLAGEFERVENTILEAVE